MSEPRYPTVHVDVREDDVDEASSMLWALGASGVEERDASTLDKPTSNGAASSGHGETAALLVAHFDDEDHARVATGALADRGWTARIEHIVGDDWKHRWREFFKPTRLGERLVIRPSWEKVEPRPGDVVLTLDPGQAFGTGTHETTRLVLMALDRRIRGGERVLDAGCGSGILSIAAVLLGAERAIAVDVDPDAIAVTNENAEANGVADRIAASTRRVSAIRSRFDVVVANIEHRVLMPMAKTLIGKVRPGGLLVLSGLLAPQEGEIREAYGALRFEEKEQERDWIALTFRAPAKATAKAKAPANAKAKAPAKAKAKAARKKSTAKRTTTSRRR